MKFIPANQSVIKSDITRDMSPAINTRTTANSISEFQPHSIITIYPFIIFFSPLSSEIGVVEVKIC